MKSKEPEISHPFSPLIHALFFVLGFSLVFIVVWGGAATALGQILAYRRDLLGIIGGVVVIAFGLTILRIIKIPLLNYESRSQWKPGKGGWLLSSFMMGVFFAGGWTPCIGTVLGAILTLGMSQASNSQALILSSGYALGLGLPFLALGAWTGKAVKFYARLKKHIHTIEIINGILLVVIGLLMVSGQMNRIASWTLRNGLYLDVPLGKTISPTYLIAVLAGFFSFLSPCVLPLVPAYLAYLSGQVIREMDSR